MLPIRNNMVWNLEAKNHESTTWADIQNNMNFTNNGEGGEEEEEEEAMEGKEEFELGSLSGLNSFLGVEDDDSWILTTTDADAVNNDNNGGVNTMQGNQDMGGLTFSTNFNETLDQNLILHSLDSSGASCSPSPASVYSNIDALSQVQSNYFLQPLPKNSTIPGFNTLSSSEFNFNSFNMGCESVLQNSNGLGVFGTRGFSDLNSQTQMVTPYLSSGSQFSTAHLLQRTQNTGNSLFFNNNGNRSQLLQPLDNNVASIGPQPTLFQKRAAQRMNLTGNVANFGALGVQIGHNSMKEIGIKNNSINGDQFEAVKIDGSNLDYDSDELTETTKITEENGIMTGGNRSNANKEVTGEDNNKGKKKGPPAKNLMAERRRREKLNDRLKMLRSVVPKISKMDRASILGDAIEYLKELRQKINNLQTELESTPLPPLPPSSSSSSFYPLTPTSSALPVRVKDELCPTPTFAGKPANIEVRTREGRGVNIHMFCGRRPGLLLSTMTALDSLGLDIQQAVISCFNGFALDIFRAEQCKEGQDIPAEHIRAILLDSAGFREMV